MKWLINPLLVGWFVGSLVVMAFSDRNSQVKVGLYIEDWKTGCQYIQNPNGGITPRIDADGVHFGCKGLQGVRE